MSLKSKKTASKSKAVVGKSKHRSFRLTPKSFMLSLIALTLVTTTSVMGWNKVQYGSFTAQAYSYQTVYYGRGVIVGMCKYRVSAGWAFRARARKTGTTSYTSILFNATPYQSQKRITLSSYYGYTYGLANQSVSVIGSGSGFHQPLTSITTSYIVSC